MSQFSPNFDYCYVQGYTAALQDVLNTFEQIQPDLKRHGKKQSYKTYKELVECMLKNRTCLREIPNSFIRCRADGEFEAWREK